MVAGTLTVEAPTVPGPVKGGLLAHITPGTTSGSRLLAGVQFEEHLACDPPGTIPEWCVPIEERGEKEVTTVGWREGANFSAFYRLQCGPFGQEGLADKAARSLDRAIGMAAEAAYVNAVAVAEETVVAGAASIDVALGLAEEQAAIMPGGHIFIARAAIPSFGSHIRGDYEEGVLITRQGTPVVNYYSPEVPSIGGTTPAAGQWWIIVTGQPHLWLGQTIAHDAVDPQFNDFDTLAERVGAVGWDCGAWAIPAGGA